MSLAAKSLRVIPVLVLAAAATVVRADDRYWALFRDGLQVTGGGFADGDSWDETSTLDGHRLFGTPNPLSVLRDTTLDSSPPGAHLLMANGDVVPGKVRGFRPADDQSHLPPRLVLASTGLLQTQDPQGLTVRADRVLRIVSSAGYPPERPAGTLVFADGRTLTATALRFTEEGVKVLTQDGLIAARFAELADVTVPNVDVIEAVLDDARNPPPDEAAMVGRLETVDGAVLTFRHAKTRVGKRTPQKGERRSGKASRQSYVHFQPSWAPAPVLVPVDGVYQRTYHPVYEVPLSLMPAEVLEQEHGIHRWSWRRNRNVEGQTLCCGKLAVGLGIGTHPHSAIAFDLPPGASQFTALVGLDNSVGDGGCTRVKVYRDRIGGPAAFTSSLLRGSTMPVPVGPLDVSKAKRLVLVTEFAHRGRPHDAAPFDIGDHVDWLLPMLALE